MSAIRSALPSIIFLPHCIFSLQLLTFNPRLLCVWLYLYATKWCGARNTRPQNPSTLATSLILRRGTCIDPDLLIDTFWMCRKFWCFVYSYQCLELCGNELNGVSLLRANRFRCLPSWDSLDSNLPN